MKITLDHAAKLLMEHHHFAITTHINPDGDAVGSLLALSTALTRLGKKVTCLIDDNIPHNLEYMPGHHTIGKPEKKLHHVDLLIILDASDFERIGRVRGVVDAPVLNIDHHISNNDFADYVYLDANRAATGEILYQLFKAMNIEIDRTIAVCLYTAIATDCGFFRFSNTTPFTMRCAAELIECGVQPNLVSEETEKKPLSTIQTLSKVLDSLEVFHDGKISCITITSEILELCDSTEGFIDFARIIDGVDLAVMVKYQEEQICRVSMRSKGLDVSVIAGKFGGGGHKRAAGCTVNKSLSETKALIVETAWQTMEKM